MCQGIFFVISSKHSLGTQKVVYTVRVIQDFILGTFIYSSFLYIRECGTNSLKTNVMPFLYT